jgi:biotin carboxyl carrier protein
VPEALTDFAAAEVTTISERVVVAPAAGRFLPLPADVFTTEGEWVEPGQVLGEIQQGDGRVPVKSEWRGWMMGMLALEGQPVRAGEALFWIWSS